MQLKILYEDNHLLVLNKPQGMLTQPSGRSGESLESLAKDHIKERDSKAGGVYLEAIHRLDRPASGLVVFAKSSKALSRLMEAVREGKMDKVYYAWTENALPEKRGALEDYVVHAHHKAKVVEKATPGAKLARLTYKEVEKNNHHTLYKIHLETGRYHQIRVQLAAKGAPIVGDIKYGAEPIEEVGILLCHAECTLPHPTSKTPLTFQVDPGYNT